MHTTEGWLMFLVAFVLLGAAAWLLGRVERWCPAAWRTADA